jgi:hypothetical protein
MRPNSGGRIAISIMMFVVGVLIAVFVCNADVISAWVAIPLWFCSAMIIGAAILTPTGKSLTGALIGIIVLLILTALWVVWFYTFVEPGLNAL